MATDEDQSSDFAEPDRDLAREDAAEAMVNLTQGPTVDANSPGANIPYGGAMHMEGTGSVSSRIDAPEAQAEEPTVSSRRGQGRRVTLVANRNGGYSIWMMNRHIQSFCSDWEDVTNYQLPEGIEQQIQLIVRPLGEAREARDNYRDGGAQPVEVAGDADVSTNPTYRIQGTDGREVTVRVRDQQIAPIRNFEGGLSIRNDEMPTMLVSLNHDQAALQRMYQELGPEGRNAIASAIEQIYEAHREVAPPSPPEDDERIEQIRRAVADLNAMMTGLRRR